MELPIKPKPSEKYFALGARQAAVVAFNVAKRYSPDAQPDWSIFKEWTQAHLSYAKKVTGNL